MNPSEEISSSTPVPGTPVEWQAQVHSLGLSAKTIHEIKLKSAYDADYINFLQTGIIRNDSFMVVYEFGP